MKIQLTTVNGYARMLEREIEFAGDINPRQRDYMNRLLQSLDQLQQTVTSYEEGDATSADTDTASFRRTRDANGAGTATR